MSRTISLSELSEEAMEKYLESTRFDAMTAAKGGGGAQWSKITNENMTSFTCSARLPSLYPPNGPIKQFPDDKKGNGEMKDFMKLPFSMPHAEITNFAKLEQKMMTAAAKANVIKAKESKVGETTYQPCVTNEIVKAGNLKWKGKTAQFCYYFPPKPYPTDVKLVKNLDKCTQTYAAEVEVDAAGDKKVIKTVGKWEDIPVYALCRLKFVPTVLWKASGGLGIKWRITVLTYVQEDDPPPQPKFSPEESQAEEENEEDEDRQIVELRDAADDMTHSKMGKRPVSAAKRKNADADGGKKKKTKADKADDKADDLETVKEEDDDATQKEIDVLEEE